MKRSINKLAFCFSIIFLLTTCKKEKSDPYEISGHVYTSCPKQAIPNIKIDLKKSGTNDITLSTTTDNNGYFKLTTSQYSLQNLFCDNKYEMTPITKENIKETVEIYFTALTYLKIYLNVTNPHTVNDTLTFPSNDTLWQAIKIHGPFTSGYINSPALLYGEGDVVLNNSNYNSIRSIFCKISGTFYPSNLINFNICDTASLTFDIN